MEDEYESIDEEEDEEEVEEEKPATTKKEENQQEPVIQKEEKETTNIKTAQINEKVEPVHIPKEGDNNRGNKGINKKQGGGRQRIQRD